LPKWLPFGAVLALVLVGLFVSGPASAGVWFVLAVFLSALGYFSWPALTPFARFSRVLAVGIVVAIGLVRLQG
jgi:hypothetical protein